MYVLYVWLYVTFDHILKYIELCTNLVYGEGLLHMCPVPHLPHHAQHSCVQLLKEGKGVGIHNENSTTHVNECIRHQLHTYNKNEVDK